MLRTTPLQPSIALDRNKATRTKQGEGYGAPPVHIQNDHRTQVLTTRRWLV